MRRNPSTQVRRYYSKYRFYQRKKGNYHWNLNRENTPYLAISFLEDGIAVIEIALDQGDIGFRGEGFGAAGSSIAGQGKYLEGRGWLGG